MSKTASYIELGFIRLNRRKNVSLAKQLYESLRSAILAGQLSKGYRLPSSRALASELGVSRTTIINAFDQLTAEGYLRGNVGRGTFVSEQLPEERQIAKFITTTEVALACSDNKISAKSCRKIYSRRGRQFVSSDSILSDYIEDLRPFRPGIPALDEFPIETWTRLVRRRWKKVGASDLSYGDPQGCLALRNAIAEYVRGFRGVRCKPEQVMIVSGTQQAVDIVARLSIDPGDDVLFENPGYFRARSAFVTSGAKIVSVPVDENGMQVDQAIAKSASSRLVYVTPSHQFPLGVTLSIERRMKLIEWANRSCGLIFEDDYDSEYRYAQRPIPSLQGLDHGNRTIYVGSFSKVMFPSLSIGYAIVPVSMIDGFQKALELVGRPPSKLDQLVLTDFINDGHFARHLRRMRTIHEQRRTALVESVTDRLGHVMQIIGADAGLHCTARLVDRLDDKQVSEKAAELGVIVKALSDYFVTTKRSAKTNGLIFGFACSTPTQICTAIRKIAPIFN